MLAFASVAVLAAAANFIVEQSVVIVSRSAVTIPRPVAPAPPRIETVSPPLATESPAPAAKLAADELIRAIERFNESVYAAVESDALEVQARYKQHDKDVTRAAVDFLSRAEELSNHSFRMLPGAIKQHQRDAGRWIELSRTRRKLLRDCSETLERMNARVNASLGRAFKILGRVVARQSLVHLNASLDALRDSFAAVVRGGGGRADAFENMTSAELAFADSLQKNAKSLRRAEGNEWLAAMEKDFGRLAELRATLSTSNHELVATASTFVNQTNKLLARMPKDAETKPLVAETSKPAAPAPQAEAAPTPVDQPIVTPLPQIITQPQVETSNRALVAWITVAVLVLLLLISMATVRSVVLPVRRLIEASARIAAGEPDARVPRGGIKELDTLAVAFNSMAERLAQAQAIALDVHRLLEEKVVERTQQLRDLVDLDPLTGLPNRRQLFKLLDASIERATENNGRVGVLFLDVDNFKNINDSVGHSFGDLVLRRIAQRLAAAAQPLGFAARLGGDEFTVICEGAASPDDIRAASEQIIRSFQSPLDVDGRELIIGVSVGASIYPDHERNAEALLIAADTALFHAKALGRGRLNIFTPELLAGTSTKFRIEQDLRRAIERDEFELFFQPEVGVEDLQTQLVEALIRWRMPDGRYVPPGEFLSVAEESGLIIEISDWVLRTAIEAAARWYHGPWPQARVAINVSPRQLLDYRFVDRVRELLTQFDLPPRCIEIELTESVLQTGPATIEQLHRLRAIGVAIALDDFGTGYSSIASLEQLPLTRVKLDRSLIEYIDSNTRSRSIVRAIIDLCNGLGLQVTAEGLERAEQFERFLGCKNLSLQGYLLARPVATEHVFTAMASAAQRAQELVLLAKPQVDHEREPAPPHLMNKRPANA